MLLICLMKILKNKEINEKKTKVFIIDIKKYF